MRVQHHGHFLPIARIDSHGILPMVIFLAASLLDVATAFGQPPGSTAGHSSAAKYTAEGSVTCLFCHNVERMRLVTKTPHGNKQNPDSPFAQHGCESCHGPGSLHATRSRRGRGRPPMINFGINTTTPPGIQSKSCLTNCHEKKMGKYEGMEWVGSVHGSPWEDETGTLKEMSCSNCHKIHTHKDPMEDAATQAKVCYTCHVKAEKEHPRFEDAAVAFNELSCWDCHDIHQLIPPQQ